MTDDLQRQLQDALQQADYWKRAWERTANRLLQVDPEFNKTTFISAPDKARAIRDAVWQGDEPTRLGLRDCKTCRHRIEMVSGPQISAFVTLSEQRCRAFKHDFAGTAEPMLCAKAFDELCAGERWEPTLWGRIRFWFGN
jgi:hypothetical protein